VGKKEKEKVKLWIIVVEVVEGMLIMIIIKIVIWRIGLFKRRSNDKKI
jgi:hypothetical protein